MGQLHCRGTHGRWNDSMSERSEVQRVAIDDTAHTRIALLHAFTHFIFPVELILIVPSIYPTVSDVSMM